MVALVSLALSASAWGAPCPPPIVPSAPWFTAVTPDGAAHVLVREATVACWWVVDDGGDGHVAARWERTRREPLGVTTLADGRAVVVLIDADARVLVRTEAGEDARAGVDPRWLAELLAMRAGGSELRAAATPSGGPGWDDARR